MPWGFTLSSVATIGSLYLARPERVDRHGPFQYRFLVEGDSWMDMSAPLRASLPHFLVDEFNRRDLSALFVNVSHIGHTLRRISETLAGEFSWWLRQEAWDGILFSGGGNDFIDAALDPPPGQGLLRDMAGLPLPANPRDCIDPAALATLVDGYLNPNVETLYQAIRSDRRNADTPLFLNGYDTPVPRNAAAARGLGPWLHKAFDKNHVDLTLRQGVTDALFADIRQTIAAWPAGRTGVHAVPTSGRLTPANPTSTGSSGDWANEIHPNSSGWRKLAPVWADEILAVVGS